MLNGVVKLMAVLLSLLLLFVYPLLESYQRQDDIAMMTAYRSALHFVDTIRDKGVLTPDMYSDFTAELGLTGYEYVIEMEHYAKRYEPDYDDPLNESTFHDRFLIRYELTGHQDIVSALFPERPYSKDDPRRSYHMAIGDYIQLKIKPSQPLRSEVLIRWLSNSDDSPQWSWPVGGMIRNEAA